MDLFTMTPTFLGNNIIDEFVSAIWTERYSSAGDVRLVVPATSDLIAGLSPGTFLGLRGTKEVMVVDTQDIKDKLMTVTGSSLITFLNQRFVWTANPMSAAEDQRVVDYVETNTPGEVIASIVNKMVIDPATYAAVAFAGTWDPANLDWGFEDIEFLELGPVDTTGDEERFTIPIGPLYDAIAKIAADSKVGVSLYLDSASPISGYVLKFTTYRGTDRTSDQEINPLVRLQPELDSLTDVKEINSDRLFKNVAYVYYKGEISKHLAEPDLPEPEGLFRRTIVVNAEGEPSTYRPGYALTAPEIAAFRDKTAQTAFANNNYIRAIDGQTSPINEYRFGVDYGLGDTIELEGLTGAISKAQVTEYIRSKDENGEREYPTITAL